VRKQLLDALETRFSHDEFGEPEHSEFRKAVVDTLIGIFRMGIAQVVEKLEPLTDAQIALASRRYYDDGAISADCVDCGIDENDLRAIARKQLINDQRQIFKYLEGTDD